MKKELNQIEKALMHALFVHLHHNIDKVIDFMGIEQLNNRIRKKFPVTRLIGPGDDAAVVNNLVLKMESHCSPCVVDPWGSAFTGGGGAMRDIVAMGGRPRFLLNFVGLGDLDKKVLVGPCGFEGKCSCGNCKWMTNKERLFLMTKGLREVCENMGVLIVGGGLSTSLDGIVPAVVVGVIGKLVIDEPLTKPFKKAGDNIILIGETDSDGNDTIFRAGLAKEMEPARALFKEERVSMEAALRSIKTGLLHSLSDLGAAGIGAATCEPAISSGLGAEIELSNVATKGGKVLSTAELVLNETQARYAFSISPGNTEDVLKEIEKVEGIARIIGKVTEEEEIIFRDSGKVVARIPNKPDKDVLEFLKTM